MASFQDILGMLVPECQSVLDFAAPRGGGGLFGDIWNSYDVSQITTTIYEHCFFLPRPVKRL